MFVIESERNDEALRTRLQEITDHYTGDNVGLQVQAIAAITGTFHHSIKLVEAAIPDRANTWRYTCYMHAFELQPPPDEIQLLAGRFDDVFPGSAFVAFLIERYLKELGPCDLANGDVVVYSVGELPRHAGKASSGAVISKWGTAHLWQHRLFELPSSHGSTVRFFRSLRRSDSLKAFLEYARGCLGREVVTRVLGQGA